MDPFSEYAFYIESEQYPKTDFTQLQFKGKIDIPALAEAYYEAVNIFPIFSSNLYEQRRGLLFIPYWEYNPEIENRLIVEDCRHMITEPFDPMDFFTRYHWMRMRRRLNLKHEFPFTAYLLQVRDDEHVFSIRYHHSSLDPYKAYKVLTAMLAGYHERVKGHPPEWADAIGMASLAQKPPQTAPRARKKFSDLFVVERIRDLWRRRKDGVVCHLANNETFDYRKISGRHSLRWFIDDPKMLEALFERAKRNEATINDLLMGIGLRAISRWNNDYGEAYRTFRMVLISSLKGRKKLPKHAGAGLAGLSFIARGNPEGDIDENIRFFKQHRLHMLDQRFDIRAHSWLAYNFNALRFLPFSVRQKIWRPLVHTIPCAFYISNVGVAWPKIVDGRPANDSLVLGAGDFVISDIHSSASIARNVGIGLTTRTHNGRMYFNFVCDRFRFREHEAKLLVDAIVKEIQNSVG